MADLLRVDPAECFVDAGFPEPVVSTGEQDEFDVVCQSADQGSRHPLVIKNINPLGKLKVCVQDH